MRTVRLRRLAPLWPLLLAAVAVAAVLASCGKDPAEPVYDNPFDPDAATGGDAFQLQGGYQAGVQYVRLTWHQLQGHGIIVYRVLHATSNVETEYRTIFERAASARDTMVQIHENPVPTQTNYYKIQALDEDENFTLLSNVVAVPVDVPPRVTIGAGDAFARQRYDTVTVKVAGYDSVVIADDPDFTAPATRTARLAVDADSVAAFVDWDLGPATGNGDSVRVFAAGYRDLGGAVVASETTRVKLTVRVQPDFTLPGGATTVASRAVDLVIARDGTGVDSMRFASSRAELPQAPWRAGGPLYEGYLLVDTPQPQRVYGEFLNFFGFSLIDSLTAEPDDLTDATTRLLLPGNRIVVDPVVTVVSDAVATHMRMSTVSNFADADWVAYADTTTFDLGTDPGLRTVYTQFRNEWYESGVFSDFAIVSAADVLIEFLAPQGGDIVRGGYPLEILGRAYSPAGNATIDSVKVDVADGEGLQLAEGGAEWSYQWDVPRLGTDTTWPLRARSYYQVGGERDSSTAVITVTISQLAVTILEPAAGDTLTAGAEARIAGEAFRFSGGPEIDSLVVTTPDTVLYPTVAPNWSTPWTPAAVSQVLGYDLIATVYAADLVEADTVQIFVQPEPEEETR